MLYWCFELIVSSRAAFDTTWSSLSFTNLTDGANITTWMDTLGAGVVLNTSAFGSSAYPTKVSCCHGTPLVYSTGGMFKPVFGGWSGSAFTLSVVAGIPPGAQDAILFYVKGGTDGLGEGEVDVDIFMQTDTRMAVSFLSDSSPTVTFPFDGLNVSGWSFPNGPWQILHITHDPLWKNHPDVRVYWNGVASSPVGISDPYTSSNPMAMLSFAADNTTQLLYGLTGYILDIRLLQGSMNSTDVARDVSRLRLKYSDVLLPVFDGLWSASVFDNVTLGASITQWPPRNLSTAVALNVTGTVQSDGELRGVTHLSVFSSDFTAQAWPSATGAFYFSAVFGIQVDSTGAYFFRTPGNTGNVSIGVASTTSINVSSQLGTSSMGYDGLEIYTFGDAFDVLQATYDPTTHDGRLRALWLNGQSIEPSTGSTFGPNLTELITGDSVIHFLGNNWRGMVVEIRFVSRAFNDSEMNSEFQRMMSEYQSVLLQPTPAPTQSPTPEFTNTPTPSPTPEFTNTPTPSPTPTATCVDGDSIDTGSGFAAMLWIGFVLFVVQTVLDVARTSNRAHAAEGYESPAVSTPRNIECLSIGSDPPMWTVVGTGLITAAVLHVRAGPLVASASGITTSQSTIWAASWVMAGLAMIPRPLSWALGREEHGVARSFEYITLTALCAVLMQLVPAPSKGERYGVLSALVATGTMRGLVTIWTRQSIQANLFVFASVAWLAILGYTCYEMMRMACP